MNSHLKQAHAYGVCRLAKLVAVYLLGCGPRTMQPASRRAVSRRNTPYPVQPKSEQFDEQVYADGRQYLVVTASEGKNIREKGDEYVAFALPPND